VLGTDFFALIAPFYDRILKLASLDSVNELLLELLEIDASCLALDTEAGTGTLSPWRSCRRAG